MDTRSVRRHPSAPPVRHRRRWYVAGAFALVAASACVIEDEDERIRDDELAANLPCSSTETTEKGDVGVNKPWSEQGVVDTPGTGYTGISAPADNCLITNEQAAQGKMNGGGCMFGAHGYDPDKCDGKTAIQSFPEGTSQSICHSEYHSECVGQPLWLSVCFAGKTGGPGTAPSSQLFVEKCGAAPENVVACTGEVCPQADGTLKCKGKLVDGNGNPVGNQTVGDSKFVEAEPGRGEGDECCRCDDTCPTCDDATTSSSSSTTTSSSSSSSSSTGGGQSNSSSTGTGAGGSGAGGSGAGGASSSSGTGAGGSGAGGSGTGGN